MTGRGLQVDGVSVAHGTTVALDGAHLDARPGEVVVVLGPSGSGKSTLLRAAAGLVAPDAGRVWIDGRDVTRDPPESRPTTVMFQDHALFPHRSARENVAFADKVAGMGRRERGRRADDWLARVGLRGLGDRAPATLSGGQQQRVALARALAAAPRVLLLDEPFGSLDAPRREELGTLVVDLARSHDVAVVLVSHDRDEAFRLGDRVAVLVAGRVRQQASPREVHAAPVDATVARLVGHTTLLGVAQATALGLDPAPSAGHRLLVPTAAVALAPAPRADGATPTVRGATVLRSAFAGDVERLVLDMDGIRVTAVDAGGEPHEPGSRVGVVVRRSRLRWLPDLDASPLPGDDGGGA